MDAVIPRTFVTQLTAKGSGAIAVLRVWGESAVAIADRSFRPHSGRKRLADSAPGELRLGWFGGDEVVAVLIEDNTTRAVEVEIQGHGSELLIDSLVGMLERQGVVRATQEAFLKARGYRKLERLALRKAGHAMTIRTAEVLHRQASGALRCCLESIVEHLDGNEIEAASAMLDDLTKTANFGTRLTSGFRVALAGRPNVGKSTLINALAGFQRTVVSPIPGTTRDAVDVSLVLEGLPIILTDTAGLREGTDDPLEAAGIRLARQEHQRADLILRLAECGENPIDAESGNRVIVVSTKADLATPENLAQVPASSIAISAKTGEGIERLIDRIVETLAPAEIAGAAAIVFDEALGLSLECIRDHIRTSAIEKALLELRTWLDDEPAGGQLV